MASYQGHLTFSSILGAGYGIVGVWYLNLDWGPVFLGAGLTTLGGLLPDLDSESSVPFREMFNLMAAVVPLLLIRRLMRREGFTPEQILVILAGVYLFIRFPLARVFKRLTVHRGMFHSIPAMLIAGLCVFLMYSNAELVGRLYLSGAMMLGFLSHLVLDELYAVDFNGIVFKRKKFSGSALKLFSSSWRASLTAYCLLGALGYLAWVERESDDTQPPMRRRTLNLNDKPPRGGTKDAPRRHY